jgi:hypothetical protein
MKEYIICSAIHFDDDKEYEHQPSGIFYGFVVSGRRHHDCYALLANIGKALNLTERVRVIIDVIGRDYQGFITNANRFVDRKEAMKIAKSANQLLKPEMHEGNDDAFLTSEDLY